MQPLPQGSVMLYEQEHWKTLKPEAAGAGRGGGGVGWELFIQFHLCLLFPLLQGPVHQCSHGLGTQATLFTHQDPVLSSEAAPLMPTPPLGPLDCAKYGLDIAWEAGPHRACCGGV